MTSSIDLIGTAGAVPPAGNLFGEEWRAQRAALQEAALPHGQAFLSCPAPVGLGGLGRHLQELREAFERRNQLCTCICRPLAGRPGWSAQALESQALRLLRRLPRASLALRCWASCVEFDRAARRDLRGAGHLIAFNGAALAQLRDSRRLGFDSLTLVAANSHLAHVRRQHTRAHRQYPLERPWSGWQLARNLAEYRLADRIHVASQYAWESFVAEGVEAEKLVHFPLTPNPRFVPSVAGGQSPSTWEIVYTGSLSVSKGTPLLIDALRRLRYSDIRLVLVGSWATRPMRRFIEKACARDPRVCVKAGDPLPHLRRAQLYVHPSYEDGFCYAAAEALACGLPALVSEDTGAKELIDGGVNGLVLPTGNLDALTEAIDVAYNGDLFGRGGRVRCG